MPSFLPDFFLCFIFCGIFVICVFLLPFLNYVSKDQKLMCSYIFFVVPFCMCVFNVCIFTDRIAQNYIFKEDQG